MKLDCQDFFDWIAADMQNLEFKRQKELYLSEYIKCRKLNENKELVFAKQKNRKLRDELKEQASANADLDGKYQDRLREFVVLKTRQKSTSWRLRIQNLPASWIKLHQLLISLINTASEDESPFLSTTTPELLLLNDEEGNNKNVDEHQQASFIITPPPMGDNFLPQQQQQQEEAAKNNFEQIELDFLLYRLRL